MLESWANGKTNARLVAAVVGDCYDKISRSKVDGQVKPQSHRIVVFLDRTVGCDWPKCDRSAIFATMSSSDRIPRSTSTRGRAITNDLRISMARAIAGNRATSGSDQRLMYDQS